MKTANIPAVRVAPELRAEIEGLLNDGESLSQFVEASVRAAVRQRASQMAMALLRWRLLGQDPAW